MGAKSVAVAQAADGVGVEHVAAPPQRAHQRGEVLPGDGPAGATVAPLPRARVEKDDAAVRCLREDKIVGP